MNDDPRFFDLAEQHADALLLDGFDDAYLGYSTQAGCRHLAVYSYEKCIEILMTRDKMSEEEAVDFFEFNVANTWMGEDTPRILTEYVV